MSQELKIATTQAEELRACLALLLAQLNSVLTEVEYEAELGGFDPRAVFKARQRTEFLASILLEDYGEGLTSLSYAGEIDRWQYWLEGVLRGDNVPDPDDPGLLFPSGRAFMEAREQVKEWSRRLLGEQPRGGQARSTTLLSAPPEEGRLRKTAPRCFVSYCRTPEENIDWVRRLATTLQSKWGVRVMVDLWDLLPGDDLGQFMRKGIDGADCVLVVCTPEYKRRAESIEGGVGEESAILTSHMYDKIGRRRVIPLLRAPRREGWPAFLGRIFGLDYLQDELFEKQTETLARAIHGLAPEDRPDQGRFPYTYGQG